jgi:hypothetical protein
VSSYEQDRPGQPDPTGAEDVWGVDELDKVLADPRDAGRMGQILAAAGAPTEAGLLRGADAARSAFRAAFLGPVARRPRVLACMSGRAAAVALCGGLVLTGGAAAASVGALPDPAQQTAKGVLAKLGLNIPGPHDATVGLARQARAGNSKPVVTAEPTTTARDKEQSATGSEVSALARCTTLTRVDKGADVSGLASDGKRYAAQHGKPASSTAETAKSPKPHASKHYDSTRRHMQKAQRPLTARRGASRESS